MNRKMTWIGIAAAVLTAISPGPPAWGEIKLTALDAAPEDYFGRAVAISNGTAIVGAFQDDDAGGSSGSAYFFDAATGAQIRKLTPNDAATGQGFGMSVAAAGGTLIVGAPGDSEAAQWSGAAYLFDVATGQQLHKLVASDAVDFGSFGRSVGISGNVAIVGATLTGIGGTAYLFDVSTGEELFKLRAEDATGWDYFGCSVAIDGGTAIVGADQDDDMGGTSGSAYLFDVATGQQRRKLTASDGEMLDYFGRFVTISGNTAMIASIDNGGAAYLFDVTTGEELHKLVGEGDDMFAAEIAISGELALISAPCDGHAGEKSGSAYLIDLATRAQIAKLTASDAAAGDEFGAAAAFDGRTSLLGTYRDDDGGADSGSAYLYTTVPGDANWDGRVDEADAAILADNWGESGVGWTGGDFDHDGLVGPADASILAANWGHGGGGESTGVPEPSAAVTILAVIGLLAMRRRGARFTRRREVLAQDRF